MVGYQAVDDDIEGGEAEIREAEVGQGTLRERAMHGTTTFAYNNPKAAACIALVLVFLCVHVAWTWLPTLIFWFLIVPGVLAGIFYAVMNKLPEIKMPWASSS